MQLLKGVIFQNFVRGKTNSKGDKVAFKEDTTGMMMPQTHKDTQSIVSQQSLDSQVPVILIVKTF